MNEEIRTGRVCPYDGTPSELKDSASVYNGRSYGMARVCPRCGAYVGCHKGTDRALGRLANAELRAAKINAHTYFDNLWKTKLLRRAEAYSWLAELLGVPQEEAHIGMLDTDQCELVAAASLARLKARK